MPHPKRAQVLHLTLRNPDRPHRLDAEIMALAFKVRALIGKRTSEWASLAHRGRPMGAAAKAKLSAQRMGHRPSEATRRKLSEQRRGRKLSPAHRAKISAGLLRMHDEGRESDYHKGLKAPHKGADR